MPGDESVVIVDVSDITEVVLGKGKRRGRRADREALA
jgi:hypothetical protein